MGNPESKVKVSETRLNTSTGRVLTNNSNTEITDLFRRFKNYKNPYNKIKDEEKEKTSLFKIKKRKPLLPLENNLDSHLKQSNNILSTLLTNHLNKNTNLNILLPFNLSACNNLIYDFPDSKQEIKDDLKNSSTYVNSIIELSTTKAKVKRINLNKITNQDISKLDKFCEIERNLNLLKEIEKINKNFESNSNSNIEDKIFITSPDKIENIYKDENEETIKSQSTRNNESLNLNTTSNSSKKEVKVIKIGTKKELPPRTKSNDKLSHKNMTPIIKKINKSPVKNIRQNSPPVNKINKSSILDKSVDKSMDRSTININNKSVIKEVPKMVLKINLKQKKNSLTESDKPISEFHENDSSRYTETIKKPSLNNSSIQSGSQFSPKIFLNQNSKGSSLSTIKIENNSNSNTIKSIGDLDIPRAPVGIGSYADRAKKQSLFQENSSKSPSRKQSLSKESSKVKVNTIKFSGKSMGLNKSSDDIYHIDDSNDKKNNLLLENENVHIKKSSIEAGNPIKSKMMFKIDLNEPDEEIETHKKPEPIREIYIPKTPKEKKNTTLSKLNKLKNIKSYLEKKTKPKELDAIDNDNDYMHTIHSIHTEPNNLDIIRESITHENDESDNGRFSFQRRATPKFDRLNSHQSDGERFSFNVFSQNNKHNHFNSENPQVRYNFDIDTNIDENELKDVDGIDNEEDLEGRTNI
jgi:hypothetical protein